MIYIRMKNYKYNKELFELIRAFYPEDELKQVDSFINQGIFIDCNLQTNGNIYGITKLYKNGNEISISKVNIDEMVIYRNSHKTRSLGVKKSIFIALEKATGKDLPWGVLTGIRPVKIVRSLTQKNILTSEIEKILTNHYKLKVDKAELVIQVENYQKDYIYPLDKDRYSLYIGIPFCPSRCKYCSFSSLPINRHKTYVDEYTEKLIYEIKTTSQLLKGKKLNTIYIGGGTPTSIPTKSLEEIIETIYKYFDVSKVKEFSVEAGRPETITRDMLLMLKRYNVDRISINPQTMNNETLKVIGRNHSSDDIIKAYHLAKELEFKTINMDLIVGLPGEDMRDMKHTLNQISKLNPENLTVHSLAIKKGSKYGDGGDKTYLENISIIEDMMGLTKVFCKKNDYIPYYLYRQKQILGNLENIGYAKEGYESIYNIAIMEERESIIGLGVGSTTKIYNPKNHRIKNVLNFKDLKSYLERYKELTDRKRSALTINDN